MMARMAAALGRHLLLLLLAAFTLAPVTVMLAGSLLTPDAIYRPDVAAEGFAGLANYRQAVQESGILGYMLNGAVVVLSILAAQLVVCLPAAYALAMHEFRGRRGFMIAVLAALAAPSQAVLLPVFLLVSAFGWIDSWMALIAPAAASAFGVLLFHRAMTAVPRSLVEAARLEGMSEAGILVRVVLPQIRPAVAAFALFSIVVHWNDYIWPLIVLSSPDRFTPALGMVYFSTYDAGANYGPLMAAATILVMPLVTFFVLMEGFVRRGFARAMTGQ